MSGTLFLCLWITVMLIMVIATVLSIKLNLRLRDHYPQIYEDVGKPRMLSRRQDFLWRLVPHRKTLSEADWRLRTILVWLYWTTMVIAVVTAVTAAWPVLRPG